MESLFDQWKTKVPNYSEVHKDLFEALSKKGGAEGEKKQIFGKHFSTNYELYIYAFFLGLYSDEFVPIPKGERKVNFSHHIQFWGSKAPASFRKDFTGIQENIFMALFTKSELDVLELDRGEMEVEAAIRILMDVFEAYTNGGLILIKEKLEENSHHFLRPTAFLDMIYESVKA